MKDIFFAGSYANAESAGIYVCEFDRSSGEISLIGSYAGLQNPTFLAVHAPSRKLYAIADLPAEDGSKRGAVAAFDIGPDHSLRLLNLEESVPASTCHIELDRTRSCLMVASYHGGIVGVSPIRPDGEVARASDIHKHEGKSILPAQDRPRAHSVTVDNNNAFAVACDLGTDEIITYKLDAANGKLTRTSAVSVAPGSGPRHFAFHPTQPYGYVINELNATIIGFHYEEQTGELTALQTVPTLPADYSGDNACADIHLSADGRFLYGSNRGHDSIAVYRVGDDGRLQSFGHFTAGGKHPRNFALSPDGAYLFAANRDTNDIVVLRRDETTGSLSEPIFRLELSKPVCVKFL